MNIACENGHLQGVLPVNIVILHIVAGMYVCLLGGMGWDGSFF